MVLAQQAELMQQLLTSSYNSNLKILTLHWSQKVIKQMQLGLLNLLEKECAANTTEN